MYDGIPAATTAIVSVSTAKWIYKPLSSLPAALSTLITCQNLVRHCVTLSLISCSQLFTCFPSCNALYKFKTYLLTYFRLSECLLGGGKTNFQLVRNFMPAVARGSFFGRPMGLHLTCEGHSESFELNKRGANDFSRKMYRFSDGDLLFVFCRNFVFCCICS